MTPDALRARVPYFADARQLTLAPLTGVVSLNNHNWRVDADGDAFLVRVGAETVHYLGVRRDEERAAARAAAAAGIAPEIVFSDSDGLLVMPFIVGRHWESADFADPAQVARLIAAVRTLHGQREVAASCTVYQRIERLLASAESLGLPIPDSVAATRQWLHGFEARRAADTRFAPGLCHNDLWANNFLDDGQRLWLLDWEFAGVGDGLYDLATLAMAGRYDAAGERALLDAYGATEPDDRTLLGEMKQVVRAFEGSWALVMHGLRGSEGDFDYSAYARTTFDALGT